MSDSYVDSEDVGAEDVGELIDADDSIEADAADAAAEIPAALTRNAQRQAQSAAFMLEHGAAASGGHSIVEVQPAAVGGAHLASTIGE